MVQRNFQKITSSNRLGKEKSPYLLQHKDNPVAWYAWGEEAFEAAKRENKPIFLSIGYSTCHWCHVMEKESFEKQDVAQVLNQHFISIKVDREERPDVDKIYMDAVVAMTGHGGWPMSLFLTTDLKPFFGGTYWPKNQFLVVLNQIAHTWNTERQKVDSLSEQMVQHLKTQISKASPQEFSEKNLILAYKEALQSFDPTHGGFGHAPKFPPSTKLQLLLRMARRTQNPKALEMVEVTLDHMARGGMYDHLGGGFHRYSTDEHWLTPHFEKMLYDNASLSLAYLEAYQLTRKEMYKEVAREILDYVLRDMTSPEGGFYSAEDADSEGEEGKFYVWTEAELKKHLTEQELAQFTKVYGVPILNLKKEFSLEIKKDPLIQSAHQKLFQVRKKRIHPYKDDKILTDWNGLMIASMAKGYQVLRYEKYLKAAQAAASFIERKLYQNQKLLKRYREGEAHFEGTLDDYAYLIFSLLTLYESDFNFQWFKWAQSLQKTQDQLFWDVQGEGYFFTVEDSPHLIRRSKEYHDEARPNSNAVSLLNLLKFHDMTFEKDAKEKAQKMLQATSDFSKKYPGSSSQLLIALEYALDRSKEIAVIGEPKSTETQNILSVLHQEFLPNKVLAFARESEVHQLPLTDKKVMLQKKTTVYVCEGQICKLPTTDLNEVKKQVSEFKKYSLE
ncbi:MAG: thioredoxin domain-containing protein [Deltaproteobacteria bacterium]|nr:thioredoxin domain-containing protein [Deltaproteobacteria bacterium]